METMNIALPGPMKAFVQAEVASGAYGSASEYIRDLIRAAQKHKAHQRLEEMLAEGLGSGEPVEVTTAYGKENRRKLTRAHRTPRNPKSAAR